jgi:hypothetical protein
MTKTWVLLSVVLGIGTIAHEARAQCVLCRCIYSTDPIGIPIRTSGPFPAQGASECVSKCTQTILRCTFPGACYPVTSNRIYQVLGRLPEIQCPNPPPYTPPYGRGARGGAGYSIPY